LTAADHRHPREKKSRVVGVQVDEGVRVLGSERCAEPFVERRQFVADGSVILRVGVPYEHHRT
jgi:hypothetical protein